MEALTDSNKATGEKAFTTHVNYGIYRRAATKGGLLKGRLTGYRQAALSRVFGSGSDGDVSELFFLMQDDSPLHKVDSVLCKV